MKPLDLTLHKESHREVTLQQGFPPREGDAASTNLIERRVLTNHRHHIVYRDLSPNHHQSLCITRRYTSTAKIAKTVVK
jgi:hypothetical protein